MVVGVAVAVRAMVSTNGAAGPSVMATTATKAGTTGYAEGERFGASALTAALGGAAAGSMGGAGAASMAAGGGQGLLGPIGWIFLGASNDGGGGTHTWDCWKQILHDDSTEPSKTGMLLKDVVENPSVRVVRADGLPLVEGQVGRTPAIVLENVWGEQFQIQFVVFGESKTLAAHATQIFPRKGDNKETFNK